LGGEEREGKGMEGKGGKREGYGEGKGEREMEGRRRGKISPLYFFPACAPVFTELHTRR